MFFFHILYSSLITHSSTASSKVLPCRPCRVGKPAGIPGLSVAGACGHLLCARSLYFSPVSWFLCHIITCRWNLKTPTVYVKEIILISPKALKSSNSYWALLWARHCPKHYKENTVNKHLLLTRATKLLKGGKQPSELEPNIGFRVWWPVFP